MFKLNGIKFNGKSLFLEEAMFTARNWTTATKTVVVNNFLENQDLFKKPSVMSENSTSKSGDTYYNKINEV